MPTRVCTRCGASKDSEDFAWKSKSRGRRHSHCKSCQSTVSTRHYENHREDYIVRAQDRYSLCRAQNESRLDTWLEGKKCVRCPESNPQTLAFIHRDESTKKSTVRRLLGQSWEVVLEEIAKCELLCANCRKKKKYV
jgi:hypothetical protein